jgi:sugar/nucleoside kinase (ribokinase family)
MAATRFDILGIGNAIVDILAEVDDAFLTEQGMVKASMALTDAAESARIYELMPPAVQTSGGSVANTCAVAAAMGASAAYLGIVAEDQFGDIFRHDITASGVHFPSPAAAPGGAPTARCLIMVTPDGQRTMNTYLGACTGFTTADLDPALIAESRLVYLEGFLFYMPEAQEACREAARLSRAAGQRVALTLSDSFCVQHNLAAFQAMVRDQTDILFANHAELTALTGLDDFDAAAEMVRGQVEIAALTRGAEGSVIYRGAERVVIAAEPTTVVDTTGAGDAYAAGLMAGLVAGESLAVCGRMASRAAAETISRMGARPPGDLRHLRR